MKQTSFRRVTLYLQDPPLFFPLHCCFCPVVGGVEIHRLVLPVISTVDLWTILSTYMDDNMIKSEVRRTTAPHFWTRRVAGLCWQSVRRCRAELLQHPGWWRIITRSQDTRSSEVHPVQCECVVCPYKVLLDIDSDFITCICLVPTMRSSPGAAAAADTGQETFHFIVVKSICIIQCIVSMKIIKCPPWSHNLWVCEFW